VRIGSLCTGYGGLDLATGGELVFVSDIDKDANTVIEQRFPGVPNLGDFTQLDTLPECDVLTAGFPCQPVSQAGRREGTKDERWLWDDIERVLGGMERPPRVVFLENVRGLLTANGGDAMGRVVSGLARLGYVGRYRLVAAADVGACHRRERVFIVAAHADRGRLKVGPERHSGQDQPGKPAQRRMDPGRSGLFGPYWPAVSRWERILGRPAPDPTTANTESTRRREEPGSVRSDAPEPAGRASEHDLEPVGAGTQRDEPGTARLNPRFVEWMMGLPDGWVTDCGLSTNRTVAVAR